METIDLINQCITESKMIEFTYKKKNGTQGQYIVEPYELRGDYLYAFDPRVQNKTGDYVGGIKQFIMAGITNPLVTPRVFTSRFKKQEDKNVG